jgi:hypothetical protein
MVLVLSFLLRSIYNVSGIYTVEVSLMPNTSVRRTSVTGLKGISSNSRKLSNASESERGNNASKSGQKSLESKIATILNKYDKDNNGLDKQEFRRILRDLDEFRRDPLPANFE